MGVRHGWVCILILLLQGCSALNFRRQSDDVCLKRLEQAGVFAKSVHEFPDGLLYVAISGPDFVDTSCLRGFPIRFLSVRRVGDIDLSPLQGLPLQGLVLVDTGITSIYPLHGMSLRSLTLLRTPVRDLSPLQGMQLADLMFDPSVVTNGIEVIRDMKTIMSINSMDADEFWRVYDGQLEESAQHFSDVPIEVLP